MAALFSYFFREIMQAGLENYKDMETYEPSADELIDVLKSLENLAAINPALYKAIVDQIKGKIRLLSFSKKKKYLSGGHISFEFSHRKNALKY